MVSPQMYLNILIKSISSSQQLWLKLTQDKANLVNQLPQLGHTQKDVLDAQLGSLRQNLEGQLIFLDKMQKHIDYFYNWYSREDIEHMAFIAVKKSMQTIFSTFNIIRSVIPSLRSNIFMEWQLLENVNSSNFSDAWPRFLVLHDEEKQILDQIKDLASANDEALKELTTALKRLAAQAKPLQIRGFFAVIELGLKTAAAAFAAFMLAPIMLPQEAIDAFSGLAGTVEGTTAGIGILEFVRKAAALTGELARR